MRLVKGIQALAAPLDSSVVTIGNFDGLHRGHQKMIQCALEEARLKKSQCVVYTFKPHPQAILNPQEVYPLILDYDEKLEFLQWMGVDLVIEEPFHKEFSKISPQSFFEESLIQKLHAQCIVAGYDFAFGKDRNGHLDLLQTFCQKKNVQLMRVSVETRGHEPVSSSRIRKLLGQGDVKAVRPLLGRPFFYRGRVCSGQGRGRQLGYPTANLRVTNKLILPYGVYVTWSWINGKKYPSVTHLGVRPTFDDFHGNCNSVLIETHFLDTHLEAYDLTLEVQFLDHLRKERKFENAQELQEQIKNDLLQARSVFDSLF